MSSVRFLYDTVPGRLILKLIQLSRLDWIIVAFLRSPLSVPLIRVYTKKYKIPVQGRRFGSFAEFFARKRRPFPMDMEEAHLISPCDGRLSSFPIDGKSSFLIKGSLYRLCDLLHDPLLCKKYIGGDCLIFRLLPDNYHRYCYIDSGFQGKNHFIPGVLHSVQPIACEKYPVYTMNRREWTELITKNFGSVVQIEIGALVVGGIHNNHENFFFHRGMEMGHFEISGSTIVMLFEKDKICLLPEMKLPCGGEINVRQGQHIGTAK